MERLFLLAGLLLGLAHLAHSEDFYVGGEQGWVVNPEESYEDWAKENRFHINDKLVFRYKRRKNSVIQVGEEDFQSCNAKNFIVRDNGGQTEVLLDQPGSVYFISGTREFCNRGQKFEAVVMEAEAPTDSPSPDSQHSPPTRHSRHSPSPSPSIAPSPGQTASASMVVASRVVCGVLVLSLGLLWA